MWYRKRIRKISTQICLSSLFGKPDIVFKKYKTVIFVDSCFWHGCKKHCRLPATNKKYWNEKIERNKQRDKEVNRHYKKEGWQVLRVWEHDLGKAINEQIIIKIKKFK